MLGITGVNPGSFGVVTVIGTDSVWENFFDIYVGQSGNGWLNISNGGRVSNTVGYIGQNPGSVGVVNVTGSGSTWANTGELRVGVGGNGTLNGDSAGKITNTSGFVGTSNGSVGVASIAGTGSHWQNSSGLHIGQNGHGKLKISNGGRGNSRFGAIGGNQSASGIVTIAGTGSAWETTSQLHVGQSGSGLLNILDNGHRHIRELHYRRRNRSGTGVVTITGSQSLWVSSNAIFVGCNGDGALNISNGGRVNTPVVFVGDGLDGVGTVTVSGSVATLANSAYFNVGFSGRAPTLDVISGGSATVANYLDIGSQGKVNLSDRVLQALTDHEKSRRSRSIGLGASSA